MKALTNRAELESQQTKHKYELSNLQKQVSQLSSQLAALSISRSAKPGMSPEETEQIITNLRSQNCFLRGEIDILRQTDSERLRELEEYRNEVEERVAEMKQGFKAEIAK
jgi:DNA-binding transcriptional MerR regulator